MRASAPSGIRTATPPCSSPAPWNGWNVSLIAQSAAPMNASAITATRRRNQRLGFGDAGGSVGRPGRPIRCALAARLSGWRSSGGSVRVRRVGGSGSKACSS